MTYRFVLFLLATSSPSLAQGAPTPPGGSVSFSATQTQLGELHVDNENGRDDDDDYVVLVDRLNLKANTQAFDAFARIDGFGFLFAPDQTYQSQVRLERIGANLQFSGVQLTVGDFYEQLGRGLVLSLRKLPEAGVDVSLLGVRAAWVGEKNSLLAFVGRTNAANMDSVNQRAVEDPRDLLAAAAYEMSPAGSSRLGFYSLYQQPVESVLPGVFQDLTLNGGTFVDVGNLVPWFSGYAEAVVQQRLVAGNPQLGSAIYLSSELRFWQLAFSFEGTMLDAFEQKGSRNTALGTRFDYNRPPTLERLDQEVFDLRDVIGLRLRSEWFVERTETLLYANVVFRANRWQDAARLLQVHAYVGFEQSYAGGQSRLAFSAGYRYEQQPIQPRPIKTAALIDVDWLHAIGDGWATHFTTATQFRTFEGQLYFWGSTFAGVEKTGLGDLTLELGYNTLDNAPKVRRIYLALLGQWQVSQRLTLQGTVGTQRGGLKCVAGVCRQWPAFSGLRFTAITRF